MHNLNEKAKQDPFFAHMATASEAHLLASGFFDDKLPIGQFVDFHPEWICTPFHKINTRNVNTATKGPIVLLTTGGFSPLHDGHIRMMEVAKTNCEKLGYLVAGGYISPSHDGYVSIKHGGIAAKHISKRIAQCQEKLADHPWLMVDPWEGMYTDRAINYTDVIRRLEHYLANVCRTGIQVAYVFGSDNIMFINAFKGKGLGVCVRRPGIDNDRFDVERSCGWSHDNVVYAVGDTIEISSTVVRQQVVDSDRSINTMMMRNDLEYATRLWPDSVGARGLALKLEKVFHGFFQVDVEALHEQHALKIPSTPTTGQFISLDCATSAKYQVGVSRAFNLADGQFKNNGLVARNKKYDMPSYGEEWEIHQQIMEIPAGTYSLIEDDCSTGETINTIKRLMRGHIEVDKVIVLASEEYDDVVDMRDFVAGSLNGGLCVKIGNDTMRVPYMLPYVSLHTRASIPAEAELAVSQELWLMNYHYFALNAEIQVRHIDGGFRKFLTQYLGFEDNDPMYKVADWHVKRIYEYNN